MKNTLLFLSLIVFGFQTLAQKPYELDLKPEKWDFKPALYYFAGVIDDRANKQNAGQVMISGKSVPAVFKDSLETDLSNYLNASIDQDTSKTPLFVAIERFKISETGTNSNHIAKLDFAIKIYRIISSKRYQIYEASGKPEIAMRGTVPLAHEKNINSTFKTVLLNFDKWINKNPDQPVLAKSITIIMDTMGGIPSSDVDTIIWNADYKLKWSDFKGTKPNLSFMAQSNCMFTYKAEPRMKDGKLELLITLKACFEKNSSWVKSGQQNDTLLGHEQLHFDICELNIRKLRNKMSTTEFNPLEYDKEIKPIFDLAWVEYQLQQQKYDDETEHGTIYEKQFSWEKEINDQLKSISK